MKRRKVAPRGKVYSPEEASALYGTDRDRHLRECCEAYVVRYNYQKPDGYWQTRAEAVYRTGAKDSHQAVEDRWRKDYPGADLIVVEYQ